MLDTPIVTGANALLALSCLGSWRAFRRATASRENVRAAQESLLLDIVRRATDTRFGRERGFAAIDSVEAFRQRVPLLDYGAHAPYVDAIAAGETNVLSPDPVETLQPSSGSTSASKQIPYTARLRQEYMRAVKPWLADLYLHRPRLLAGTAYWALTPSGVRCEANDGGTPVGFDDDSRYFGSLEQRILRRVMAVPDEVARIGDMDAFQYTTLLFLLSQERLALISVWSPTFLTLLLGRMTEWADALARDLHDGTLRPPSRMEPWLCERLASRLRRNRRRARMLAGLDLGQEDLGSTLWPELQLISCWCDAGAARHVPAVERLFPGVEIQPKGLLATEGAVSIPFLGQEGGLLAVRSHFLEFLPGDGGTPRLAHELDAGQDYSIVLTTGGGLYRYRLHDRVRVLGYARGVARIRFLGKEDHVSDVAGEKLNALHVEQVLAETWERQNVSPGFALLAPEGNGYVLFVQGAGTAQPGRDVEAGLRENFHYDYCRRLGQLGPLRVYRIDTDAPDPAHTLLAHLAASGAKLGAAKPSVLAPDLNWSAVFRGQFVPSAEREVL